MSNPEREIHVGVSWLRTVTKDGLKQLPELPVIIHDHAQPVSVLIRYDLFMQWQDVLSGRGVKGIK